MPMLGGQEDSSKWITAEVVPSKGMDSHVVSVVCEQVHACGFAKLAIKSDQESPLVVVLEAAKRERAEQIDVVPEESQVASSASNGSGKRTIQSTEGPIRTFKSVVEENTK